ncbi:MAG TPA: ATP-binding protein [Puia sp.]|nr:ATP-binding protein [Puia sp.]
MHADHKSQTQHSGNTRINSRQFEALFNNVIIGILITNQHGEIIGINKFAEIQFGYVQNELIGEKIEKLIPHRFHNKHVEDRAHFYKSPKTRMMGAGLNLFALRKDGIEFPAEISLSNYELDGETYVIALIVDATARKQNELQLLEKNSELEKATGEIRQLNEDLEKKVTMRTEMLKETLTALEQSQQELKDLYEKERELNHLKSRFVSMASHEFRTPLSTILSSVDLIKRYTSSEDTDKREKHIEKIQNAVRNLGYILDDFLSLGKLEEGLVEVARETIDAQDMIAETETLAQEIIQSFRKAHQLEFHHSLQNTSLALDRKLLRNILTNLVSNAAKYSPEKSMIKIHFHRNAQGLTITVSDDGIGIPEKDQEHLFERFFRAGNVGNIQGTGLGLYIVKRYIELMGGNISLKTQLKPGTTFEIFLPQP